MSRKHHFLFVVIAFGRANYYDINQDTKLQSPISHGLNVKAYSPLFFENNFWNLIFLFAISLK